RSVHGVVFSVLFLLSDASVFFFFQAEDGIRDATVTGVQTCALPISARRRRHQSGGDEDDAAVQAALAHAYGVGVLERGLAADERSEERRVGKECRSRWVGEE